MRSALTWILVAALPTAALAGTTVFGLKSTASGSAPSLAPTRLFSFDGGSGIVNDLGWVTYAGNQVNADGLATDGTTLYAFLLEAAGSRLVTVDPNTAVASSVAFYQGTAIRGATLRAAKVYALDVVASSHWNVVEIDLVPLTLTSVALDTSISDACDLDFDGQGTLWVAEANAFHTLNPSTGALSFVAADLVPESGSNFVFNAGFAFDKPAVSRAFTLDVNTNDDVYTYNLPNPTRTMFSSDILASFNAGRGDLAAVPEPATLAALGLGCVTLLRRRRR